jgi:hypothetical protein
MSLVLLIQVALKLPLAIGRNGSTRVDGQTFSRRRAASGQIKESTVMKPTKLNRFQTFVVCWTFGAISYLTDCLIVSTRDHPPDVPWIERGIYSGIGILFTVSCFAPILVAISNRIDSQPRQ